MAKRMKPKVYDPSLIEYEEAKFALPYTDGIVQFFKKYDNRVEIKTVRLSREEWEGLRSSRFLDAVLGEKVG